MWHYYLIAAIITLLTFHRFIVIYLGPKVRHCKLLYVDLIGCMKLMHYCSPVRCYLSVPGWRNKIQRNIHCNNLLCGSQSDNYRHFLFGHPVHRLGSQLNIYRNDSLLLHYHYRNYIRNYFDNILILLLSCLPTRGSDLLQQPPIIKEEALLLELYISYISDISGSIRAFQACNGTQRCVIAISTLWLLPFL